jgi:hypothetical protein
MSVIAGLDIFTKGTVILLSIFCRPSSLRCPTTTITTRPSFQLLQDLRTQLSTILRSSASHSGLYEIGLTCTPCSSLAVTKLFLGMRCQSSALYVLGSLAMMMCLPWSSAAFTVKRSVEVLPSGLSGYFRLRVVPASVE